MPNRRLLEVEGGALFRRIQSYGFLLCRALGDSCPEDGFMEAGSSAAGCPENSGGLNPSGGPTAEELGVGVALGAP
jgi:hypothetical protein